jgi:hypothetical protein
MRGGKFIANGTEREPNSDAALKVRKYNPDEPRVPAGNPDGGRWTELATNDDANDAVG